jgi:hypothetical protein
MGDNYKAGCLGCYVVALIYSAVSVAVVAVAINAGGFPESDDPAGIVAVFLGPGVIAFIPLALVGVVLLVMHFVNRE